MCIRDRNDTHHSATDRHSTVPRPTSADAPQASGQDESVVHEAIKNLNISVGWNKSILHSLKPFASPPEPAKLLVTSPIQSGEHVSHLRVPSSSSQNALSSPPHGGGHTSHGRSGHHSHHASSARKKSVAYVVPKITFRRVRKQPAWNFCLPDGNTCPFVAFLLQNAPSDASYSDGDFLCRFSAEVLSTDCSLKKKKKKGRKENAFISVFVLFLTRMENVSVCNDQCGDWLADLVIAQWGKIF